jgi:hypothetical protein
LLANVRRGIKAGLTVAIGFSIIAVVISFATGTNAFDKIHQTMIGGLLIYCIGGVVLGAIGGVLLPFMRGTVGMVLASMFLGALAYLLFKVSDASEPMTWGILDAGGAAAFAVVGLVAAFTTRTQLRALGRARAERNE